MNMSSGLQGSTSADLGVLLRKYRESKARSIRQLAERCGIGRSTLSRWECGASRPNRRDLDTILSALGLSEQDRQAFEPYRVDRKQSDPQSIARRRLLRAARLRNGLSLGEAAARIGVSKATLSRWETGDRKPDRARMASAAEALGATKAEVLAIGSPGNLFESDGDSLDTLCERVDMIRKAVPRGCSGAGDLDFLGLDAALAKHSTLDSRRLRLELRAAYVEWLGWWYRDVEASEYAQRLLPTLGREPSLKVWGRVLRACSNYASEYKRDPDTAIQLLSEATRILSGCQSEGFVRRELAGLLLGIGDVKMAREEIARAREAATGEEDLDVHLYCCSMVDAACWSELGNHELAIASLPTRQARDSYLASSSAIGRARIYAKAGEADTARTILERALRESEALGLHHFSQGLRKRLQVELL